MLKQRLTGAIVLVLAAVVFIPMLLRGPERTETRRIDLPVPAQTEQEIQTHSFELESAARPRPQDEKAVAPAAGALIERAAPAPMAVPVRRDDARTAVVVPSAEVSAWAVQVGSFAQEANARRLTSELEERGYAAFTVPHSDQGRTVYRVRIGPESGREEAEVLAGRLRREGEQVAVVRHP